MYAKAIIAQKYRKAVIKIMIVPSSLA